MPKKTDSEKTQSQKPEQTSEMRRATLRAKLIDCAERRIAVEGLKGLNARALAVETGCALGALYNLVADMDELALLVASRTARELGLAVDAATLEGLSDEALLANWARAYFHYARDNTPRWRALFEYRAPGAALPEWFEAEQAALFARLEDRLAPHLPGISSEARQIKARVLFSAIHGIAVLALEDKFTAMPAAAIDGELDAFVAAYLRGLRA